MPTPESRRDRRRVASVAVGIMTIVFAVGQLVNGCMVARSITTKASQIQDNTERIERLERALDVGK